MPGSQALEYFPTKVSKKLGDHISPSFLNLGSHAIVLSPNSPTSASSPFPMILTIMLESSRTSHVDFLPQKRSQRVNKYLSSMENYMGKIGNPPSSRQ
jgi:hypothetical protein